MPQAATATQDDELAKYAAKPAGGDDELSKYAAKSAPKTPSGPTGNAGTEWHPLVTPQAGESFADTMRRGAEMGKQVTPEQRSIATQEAIRQTPTVLSAASLPGLVGGIGEAGMAGKLIPFAKRLATGAVGGYAGEKGGSYVGGPVGGLVGGLLGGSAGLGLFGERARAIGNPSRIPVIGKYLPDFLASEAGHVQIPPEPIPEPLPPETIPDRLGAHRGDVRTPMPRPATIRRGPGEILPESVSSGPDVRVGEAPRSGTSSLPGGGVIKRPPIGLLPENVPSAPLPARPPQTIPETKPSMGRLGELIEEGAGTPGTPRLLPKLPLREQARPNLSVGQSTSEIINKATEPEAVRPLASGPQKNMPLREIAKAGPPTEEVPHRATVTHEGKTFGMEAANGRAMYEATQHDTALAKSVHDLRNNDVRQAFLAAGGDVNTVGMEGQRFKVGSTTSNERSQMFDYMLKKGLKPQEIVDLARSNAAGTGLEQKTIPSQGTIPPQRAAAEKASLKTIAPSKPAPSDAELQKTIDTLRAQRNRTNDPARYQALDKKYKAAMEQFYKGKAEPEPEAAPPAKQSRTANFDSLPKEDQEWIGRWAKEVNHLPQSLREAEMGELKKFGDQGTLLKERIAMQHIAKQANPPAQVEPGEERAGGASGEAFRSERQNYEQQRERTMRRMKPDREPISYRDKRKSGLLSQA